jgi:hypothetical protein
MEGRSAALPLRGNPRLDRSQPQVALDDRHVFPLESELLHDVSPHSHALRFEPRGRIGIRRGEFFAICLDNVSTGH